MKVQAGAAKRLGKRSATGTSESSNSLPRGVHGSGVGDGMVAMGTAMIGDRRGAAGMSSRAMCL